jgi:hypothetical protein
MLRSLLAFAALLGISVWVSSRVRKSSRFSRSPDAWWNADALGWLAFYGMMMFGTLLILVFDSY